MPASRVTAADLAAWRAELAEEGDGEYLDPTLAQQIAPRLLAEVDNVQPALPELRRRRHGRSLARHGQA
jgi:hypothetical protein